ncbi:MAG: hypothetical protein MH137_08670 [Flavobacteriales bacterium]|nr:hypothetical protein [Flavobacteriales bacterium]
MTKKLSLYRIIRNRIRLWIDLFVLWITAKAFGWMLAIFLSFPYRSRMSHNNGIAGQGQMKIVGNPEFPEHPFYAAGKVFPVRVRHASATFLDDAMNCIRSISIKLSHNRFKSPFDIEMNSGQTSLFWSAASFLKFGSMRKEKWGVEYVEYNRLYPEGLKGAQQAVRRHATSFHNVHYYSKTPFLFVGKDGIKRYAKYRVKPFDDEPESGIDNNPSDWDMSNQRVLPHETRGRNFLKYEYEDRVKREGAKYRLQIQTRIAQDDDDPEVFNNMILWDEQIFPWQDLGVIEITEVLDWKESTRMGFSVNNMPKTLGVLPAKSIFDYNSLNYLRAHSEIARKARMWSYWFWGVPPEIPDNDNRNVSDWGK